MNNVTENVAASQPPTENVAASQPPTGNPASPIRQQTVILSISNMHCAACVKKIATALQPFGSSVTMQPEVATRTLSLSWKTTIADSNETLNALISAISKAGFPAQLVNISNDKHNTTPGLSRIAVAVLFTMQTMMLALSGYLGADDSDALIRSLMDHAQWVVATPVVLYSGWPFLYGAWRDASSRQVTMDLPVGIAIATAYTFSAFNVIRGDGVLWFDSATMFVTLLLIARQLEASGRTRATEHLHTLFRQQKNTARKTQADGTSKDVATSLVKLGDIVEVHPSEALPVDGVALSDTLVSEAVLTGEATPKAKSIGDALFAGSILLGSTPLRVQTTASGQDTSLGRIIQLMHQALTSRPRVQQLADSVARYFVLCVLALAAIGGIAWSFCAPEKGLNVALTVLVASCPCALSLATPTALAASVSRLARRGVMVLKMDGFMRGSAVDHIVFDKTGTLTSSELQIETIYTGVDISVDAALSIASGLEQISRHPIASAFSAIAPATITQPRVEATAVSGQFDGTLYSLRASQVDELKAFGVGEKATAIPLTLSRENLFGNEVPVAIISLFAPIRRDAKHAIVALKRQGIQVSLYSGDNLDNVTEVAHQLGIDDYAGALTPTNKLNKIKALQAKQHCVAAVGDGVNDAPLLAAADMGIAMGSGTAQAQSGASLVLSNNQLESIIEVLVESSTLKQRIRQNIIWAIAYNLTVFPLALSGTLPPWLAAIGMASSSILVVSNALRGSSIDSVKEPISCQP